MTFRVWERLMSIEVYLAYVLACILITIIPGPTVTLIIANSLTHGTRAGLLNVAGTQLGLAIMLGVLLVGLSSIIATMGVWFDWVRIAGAVYLIWLGWKLLRANAGFGVHTVRDGDTLPSIAYQTYGDATRWRLIAEANDVDNPLHLRRGTPLSLPKLET